MKSNRARPIVRTGKPVCHKRKKSTSVQGTRLQEWEQPIVFETADNAGNNRIFETSWWAEGGGINRSELQYGGTVMVKIIECGIPIQSHVCGHVQNVNATLTEWEILSEARQCGQVVGFWMRKNSDGSFEGSGLIQ